MRAEQWTDVITHHGEGPVWWPDQTLRLVDMLSGEVVTVADGEVTERTTVGSIAAVVRPAGQRELVVARERDVVILNSDAHVMRTFPLPVPDGVRLNEGCCTPEGDLIVGSMAYNQTPGAGSLYRVSVRGQVETILTGVTVSNGIGFTRDASRCLYIDSAAARVDALTFDDAGILVDRRPFATIDDGVPDGLVVDADGGVFVAVWGGARVDHFDRDGNRDAVIELPVAQPTACTLGGHDGRILYVTSSRYCLPDSDTSQAGAIFRCEVGVTAARVEVFGPPTEQGRSAP